VDIEGRIEGSQSGELMEKGQSGEGVWRARSALWTCSRGPMRNLVEDGEACSSFVG